MLRSVRRLWTYAGHRRDFLHQRVIVLKGVKILVVPHTSKLYALASTCHHKHRPLFGGIIHDKLNEPPSIECPWHLRRICLQTGRVRRSRDSYGTFLSERQQRYTIRIDVHNCVFIDL
jgi:nitrite reductase/ring-hydroxylating ferredoxin subunit